MGSKESENCQLWALGQIIKRARGIDRTENSFLVAAAAAAQLARKQMMGIAQNDESAFQGSFGGP